MYNSKIATHIELSNLYSISLQKRDYLMAGDKLTQAVKKVCDTTLSIHFLDHVIVCEGNFYSYADSGRL